MIWLWRKIRSTFAATTPSKPLGDETLQSTLEYYRELFDKGDISQQTFLRTATTLSRPLSDVAGEICFSDALKRMRAIATQQLRSGANTPADREMMLVRIRQLVNELE
jgi:hypothetical protein